MVGFNGLIAVCVAVLRNPLFQADAFLSPSRGQRQLFVTRPIKFKSRDDFISAFFTQRCARIALNNDVTSLPADTKSNAANEHERDSSTTTSQLPQVETYQKPRQVRRIPIKRKPRNYWQSTTNLWNELSKFWIENNVPIDKLNPGQPPPIPSEHLLNFFGRNDLRGAIASIGGREQVSYLLGGAKIIPGRWKDAVELKEVKLILPLMHKDDFDEKEQQQNEHKLEAPENQCFTGWNQTLDEQPRLVDIVEQPPNYTSCNDVFKPEKQFWTKEKIVLELYRYLESYKKYKQRPSVWMPQLAELSQEGFSELFNACSRFKKLPAVSVFSNTVTNSRNIEDTAGLVPYKEWRFFDSQLQLFVELKHYLDVYQNGLEDVFPDPLDVKKRGYTNLYHLIRTHGGKVLLAQKLSMKLYRGETREKTDINWGPITLGFIIQLLHFIRSEFMVMSPPLTYPMISMPLEKDLLRRDREDLAALVVEFGGYENIARRLGLAYFDGKSRQMNELIYKGARYLWKQRTMADTSLITKSSIKSMHTNKLKRKGIAWTKDIVVEELYAYVKVNMTKRSLAEVWMPTFSQLDKDNRTDLKNAISRNGGQLAICKAAGLIPNSVYTKFESFKELVKELLTFNEFLAASSEMDEKTFIVPTPQQMVKAKATRLSELIRLFGGTNVVEDLLLINGKHQLSSLSCLVELTEFIHTDMMSSKPPFSHEIRMPTRESLIRESRDCLLAAIQNNGGFKTIANILPGVQLDKQHVDSDQ